MSSDKESVAWARDRQFADLLVLQFGLAAETHPDILRAAIGKVFDLSAIEETHGRMMRVLTEAQQQATQARELLQQISLQLEEVERRFDALEARHDPRTKAAKDQEGQANRGAVPRGRHGAA